LAVEFYFGSCYLSIIINVCNTYQKYFKLIVTIEWHSYFAGGPVFKSQVGDQISWLKFLFIPLSHCNPVMG